MARLYIATNPYLPVFARIIILVIDASRIIILFVRYCLLATGRAVSCSPQSLTSVRAAGRRAVAYSYDG